MNLFIYPECSLQLAISSITSRIYTWKDTEASKSISSPGSAGPSRCQRSPGSHQGIDKGRHHQRLDNDVRMVVSAMPFVLLDSAGLTFMSRAVSAEEAATYIEKYKAFERKPPDLIKERRDNDYMSHMNAVLTNVRGINKTDVVTLTSNFGSLKEIVLAPPESLLACPGLGEKKVKRLREAFTSQFVVKRRKTNAEKRGEIGPSLN